MDRLDVRILRTLLQDPAYSLSSEVRRSYGAIARKVGADEGTVRNRIRKLHETRFIEGWSLGMNPGLTGGGWVGTWFDVSPSVPKSRLVEDIKLLPGVFVIVVTHGSLMWTSFRYANESSISKQVELIRRMAGAEEAGVGRIPFPECTIHLSASDRALLRAVGRNPRRTYASIAKDADLSGRTVRRRLRRMIEGNAVFGFAALNPKGVKGAVMASVLVTYPFEIKGRVNGTVMGTFDDYIYHVLHMLPFRPGDPTPSSYNMMLPNVPKGREVLDVVKQIPGVQMARMELFEAVHTMFEPIEAEVQAT